MTSQSVRSILVALDPLEHHSMEAPQETNNMVPDGIPSSSNIITERGTPALASTVPMPRRDSPPRIMMLPKSNTAKDVMDQHSVELLANYPTEIGGYHDPQGNHYDATDDSCISSITRELPDIDSESMYPSPEKVREALLEPIVEGADATDDSQMTSGTLTISSVMDEANEKQTRIQIDTEVPAGAFSFPEEPSGASGSTSATAVSPMSSLDSLEHLIHAKAAGVIPAKGRDVSAKSSNREMEPVPIPSGPTLGGPSPPPVAPDGQGEDQACVGFGVALAQRYNQDVDAEAPREIMHDASVTTTSHATNDTDQEQAHLTQAQPVPADQPDLQVAESMEDSKFSRRRQMLHTRAFIGFLALFIGVVVVAVVVVVVVVTMKSSTNSDPVNSEKLAKLVERRRVGEEIKIHLEAVLGYDFFQKDARQPQTAAWNWLVFDDPLQLNRKAPNLLQRFLLVYFYHTMTRKGQWRGCNPKVHNGTFHNSVDLCYYEGLIGDGMLRDREFAEVLATRWLTGTHECQWAGVFCDENDLLEAIHLDKMLLNGTFPTEIAHLQSLRSLSFVDNHLSGRLPSELGNLNRLTFLDLQGNQFTGPIPFEWWDLDTLELLNLGLNPLSVGTIPAEIQKLSNLFHLNLDSANITGSIPLQMFELTNLTWLMLGWNALEGPLPVELTLLHEKLEMLSLIGNQFTGTIPSEISLLTSLLELDLYDNHFTGTIPEEIYFSEMKNLYALLVGENNLSGSISTNVVRLTTLSYLLMAKNPLLTGTVPTELGLLTGLVRLDIQLTGLRGSIPKEICALRGQGASKLTILKADCQPISSGEIPMVCPIKCCSRCCNQETRVCADTVV